LFFLSGGSVPAWIDSLIVVLYFVIVFVAGYFVSRRFRGRSAEEFLTGRGTTNWWQTGLTIIAMAVDPSIMGLGGLGFLWGLYPIQWTGTHVWFTAWFAAMFFVPIYWRTKITTTPEYLEKRFNVQCRTFFSLVMVAILVVTLASGLYLGTLLLKNLLGWSIAFSLILICFVMGFYVILGGMKTVLTLDIYQSMFLIVTTIAIPAAAVIHWGGIPDMAAIRAAGNAGTRLVSVIPPSDWNLNTRLFFPIQAVVTWATVAGLSWLICNFGMAQRLLAAKSERDAQKALLLVGIMAQISCLSGFITGLLVRAHMPDILPDESFIKVIITMFPVGVKGLVIAGLMAALLSTVDGVLTASSTLLSEDIYLRFLRPRAGDRELKLFARIVQAIVLICTISLFPLVIKSASAMTFVQSMYGDLLGVVVAIYLVGLFSKRITPGAAFTAMITGIAFAAFLDAYTPLNFAYVGYISFLYTVGASVLLSRFQKPLPIERLVYLTVFTVRDAKGPWIGLKSWPDLWKWAIAIPVVWFGAEALWQWYIG
jgi:solute:Na+ symporter, SSS family